MTHTVKTIPGTWYTITCTAPATVTQQIDGETVELAVLDKSGTASFRATAGIITITTEGKYHILPTKAPAVTTGNSSGGSATPPTLYPVAPTLDAVTTPPYAGSAGAVAIGDGAWAPADGVSIGLNAKGGVREAVAIGFGSYAGWGGVAIGGSAKDNQGNSVVAGQYATGTAPGVTAVGYTAIAEGESSIAVGEEASARGTCGIAVGSMASANLNSVAVGKGATADAPLSIAIGDEAKAWSEGGVAIGPRAIAQGMGVVITYGAVEDIGDIYAQDGEIVFAGMRAVKGGYGIQQLSFVPEGGENAQVLAGRAGIVWVNAVFSEFGSLVEYQARGATWEELLPHDLMAAAEATPATMSLEDEPAHPNLVQRFMQMAAKIQARKQAEAAANS